MWTKYDIKFYTLVTVQCSASLESFITLTTEMTKLRCFSSWQLSSCDVIKNVSTMQNSTNTIRANTFLSSLENVFRHPLRTFVKLLVTLGTALLIGPTEKCPISSPVRFLFQKLFWISEEVFKIALCVALQTW